jgi:hypothetical protein
MSPGFTANTAFGSGAIVGAVEGGADRAELALFLGAADAVSYEARVALALELRNTERRKVCDACSIDTAAGADRKTAFSAQLAVFAGVSAVDIR